MVVPVDVAVEDPSVQRALVIATAMPVPTANARTAAEMRAVFDTVAAMLSWREIACTAGGASSRLDSLGLGRPGKQYPEGPDADHHPATGEDHAQSLQSVLQTHLHRSRGTAESAATLACGLPWR